ncbi:hypothetical protein, partial [Enterococcus hirae]|uniref:hypothetical protein n=1 Tax=Enterococcus hirae TaxID=1354 RepID=UPI001A96E3B8
MAKKNMSKAKRIRKQLLAASATGLVLVSSVASAGTSFAYATEKDTAEQEQVNINQKNKSSDVVAIQGKNTSENLYPYNWGTKFSYWYNTPNNFNGQWQTIKGASYKVVFSGMTSQHNPNIKFDIQADKVTTSGQWENGIYNLTISFTANSDTTNFTISGIPNPDFQNSKITSTLSDVPVDLLEHRSNIDNIINNIFNSDGSVKAGITQDKINLDQQTLKNIIPTDSLYWKNYIMPMFKLAGDLVTVVPQLKNEVLNLFGRNGSGLDYTHLSSNTTQAVIDQLQNKIDALSSGSSKIDSEKQALQQQLDQAQNLLQEIQIKSTSGEIVAQLDANNSIVYVRTFAGNVSGSNTIGSIQIKHPMYNSYTNLFKHDYKGGVYKDTVSQQITASVGDTLVITTNECPLSVNKNVKLSNLSSTSYVFKLKEGGNWGLESSNYENAKKLVDALFDGDTPKTKNTQEQINNAKNQVNGLLNGSEKESLLAKIDTAQKA